VHPPGPGNGRAAHPREAYGSSEKTISNDADSITYSTGEGKRREAAK
jgi:hypothetical protein